MPIRVLTSSLRALISSVCSLLLLATTMWGGCVSCDQFFMWRSTASSCCSPSGHCKSKTRHSKGVLSAFHSKAPVKTAPPAKPQAQRDCKQLAFERHSAIDHQLTLVALNENSNVIPISPARSLSTEFELQSLDPSPPDPQALFSTFLI